MAKDQLSRDIFDAMMQEMIGNYSGDRYDEPRRSGPSRSTPRSHRYEEDYRDNGRYHRDPPMRSPRDDYRSRGPDSRRSSYPGPHRREYEEESYHSYYDRRRSGSPSRSRDRSHSEYRDHDFAYSRSRDASWSEEPEYYQERPHRDRGLVSPRGGYNQRGWGHSPRDDFPRGRGAGQGPRGRGASQGPPGRGGFPAVRGRGTFQARGRASTFVPRGRGGFFTTRGRRPGGAISLRGRGGRGGSLNDKAPVREQSLKALMEKADALSNFESQVIRWAGFHEVDDSEFTPKNSAHSTLETDTCINTLTSFRCFFKPELRYFCFLAVRTLNHSALKKPKIDGDFFQLLMEKGAVADKFSFSKVINPLDKHLTIFQTYLLKSAHPLLLACNEHELDLKKVTEDAAASAEESTALEKSISLCRKGLVLLGQTFAVVTSFRQEKILEAAGLLEVAPKPTDYPNLNDSLLFGKEYMTRLKEWLEESGHKIKVKSDQVVPEKGLKPEPQVKETLDSLLEKAVNSWKEKEAEREKAEQEAKLKKEMEKVKDTEKEDIALEDVKEEVDEKGEEKGEEKDTELESNVEKEKEVEMETEQKEAEAKPDFWFLFDEDSQEFKYYQQKLAEIQKLKREAAEAKLKAEKQKLKAAQLAAAQKAAAEVAAAEKAAAEKRVAEKAAAKQAAEKAATEKKAAQKAAAEKAAAEKADKASKEPVAKKTIVKTATPAKQKKQKKAATKALTGILKKTKGAAAASDTSDTQTSEMDDKTKETAENLARFIVQMGTGIKDFNMESLTSNPDFWFLNDEESQAYIFYQSKVTEFRESPEKIDSSESSDKQKVQSKDSEKKKSDPSPKKTEVKDSKSKEKTEISESQENEPQASESQDIEESEDKSSQEQMECEAAESASSDGASQSATSTPARSPLTRKRGRPMRGGRGAPAKRVCQVEEAKVEEPTKVGNEKPSGRPALRKKQIKQKETLEQNTEDDGVKVGDISDAEDGDE